jgi:hypothetical protein
VVADTPSPLAGTLPSCRSSPGGVENVCRDAPQVLMEEHAQSSRRNRLKLYSVREEQSDRKEEEQFPQAVPRKRATRVCRHGIIGPAAENGTREPLPVGSL